MASRPISRTFAEFVPQQKQDHLPSFRFFEFEEPGPSVVKISETSNSTLSSGIKSQLSMQASQTPSLSASRRLDGSNPKRLKLKDYLHLNSIQKKSKKSNSTAKKVLEQSPLLDPKKYTYLSQSANQPPPLLLQSAALSDPLSAVRNPDSTQILKEDIRKRIESQIAQLNDLANYVKNDVKPHQNQEETQFLLFNILNSVVNGSKAYQAVSEQIIGYQVGRKDSNSQYFWHKRTKSLESPAKILKKGLEIKFNFTQHLHGNK